MGPAITLATEAGINLIRGLRSDVADYAEGATEKQESNPEALKVIGFVIGLILAIVLTIMSLCMQGGFPDEVERWRSDVMVAETNLELDTAWTNQILAMMQVESGGNTNVSSVLGAANDIMQAAEGQGSHFIWNGSEEFGFAAQTPQASIHAGVEEFKACIESFEKYLGRSPSATSLNDFGLLAQGYNYGHVGWFSWLSRHGYDEYSIEISQQYQSEVMGGAGTATHGQKCMDAYSDAMANPKFGGLFSIFGLFGSANYVQNAYQMAMDDSIGYSMNSRTNQPDVDCSSFVYYSLLYSGYTEAQLGSYPFTTWTMGGYLKNCGFTEYSFDSVRNSLQSGDILVRSNHTEIVYDPSDNSTLGAHSNYDNQPGDSSGREVNITAGNAQGNWTWVYRLG